MASPVGPAAVGASATMETSATAGASPAMEASATAVPATTMKSFTPSVAATSMKSFATSESAATPFATAVVPSTAVVSAASVEPVEPRACADEHAPVKIVRAVVAVRRAGVRRISIVAVCAYRGRSDVSRPIIDRRNANTDADPYLRASRSRHSHAKPKQNCKF